MVIKLLTALGGPSAQPCQTAPSELLLLPLNPARVQAVVVSVCSQRLSICFEGCHGDRRVAFRVDREGADGVQLLCRLTNALGCACEHGYKPRAALRGSQNPYRRVRCAGLMWGMPLWR